jgi:formylglycine-generating enzyme required for sulfatase activity
VRGAFPHDRRIGLSAALAPVCLLIAQGCHQDEQKPGDLRAESTEVQRVAAVAAPKQEERTGPPSIACPTGRLAIPGGEFWVGSPKPTYESEENPQFRVRVAPFCADRTEVTAQSYASCVAAGRCQAAAHGSGRCTLGSAGKESHPINCITWYQAEAVCGYLGGRLPTEIEWEFLARGGSEMLAHPWGAGTPDETTCWKHHETCEVGKRKPQAFGLMDVSGNVWEWTSSWFGPYPWPAAEGRAKVYRGGSWSRRFEKWLSPTLRNRSPPTDQGSHLGVRCVSDLAGPSAPEPPAIVEVRCPERQTWNGWRCAAASDSAPCPEGSRPVPGRGCLLEEATRQTGNGPAAQLDLAAVSRSRTPEFDADCERNQPKRPHAYRYSGGEHLARNARGKQDGCQNRDVGVGWNSSCCP